MIVSHWRDNVCVATTPVGVKELAGLIGLLVRALQDSVATSSPTPGTESIGGWSWKGLVARSRRRLVAPLLRHRAHARLAGDDNVVRAA